MFLKFQSFKLHFSELFYNLVSFRKKTLVEKFKEKFDLDINNFISKNNVFQKHDLEENKFRFCFKMYYYC